MPRLRRLRGGKGRGSMTIGTGTGIETGAGIDGMMTMTGGAKTAIATAMIEGGAMTTTAVTTDIEAADRRGEMATGRGTGVDDDLM